MQRGTGLAQQIARALAASTAARAHAKGLRQLVERANTFARGVLNLPVGHGIADADVHDNPYLVRIIIMYAILTGKGVSDYFHNDF